MSPRARVGLTVGALALLAGVVVAGAAVLSAEEIARPAAAAPAGEPQEGAPRLSLALALRTDPDAEVLRQAVAAYDAGRLEQAAALFGRSGSLEAKLGAAFAAWPGSIDRVEQLGALYPRSAMVQLHVGIARFWAGRRRCGRRVAGGGGRRARHPLRGARRGPAQPRVRPGAPDPRQRCPLRLRRLREAVGGGAAGGAAQARCRTGRSTPGSCTGSRSRGRGRPLSAREVYSAAAEAFPEEPEALVADAVGRYSKDRPAAAFSRLGPLSQRFPSSASVRFHLGLLLLWQGDVGPARRQLKLAQEAEPGSFVARRASLYLDELAEAGTG